MTQAPLDPQLLLSMVEGSRGLQRHGLCTECAYRLYRFNRSEGG